MVNSTKWIEGILLFFLLSSFVFSQDDRDTTVVTDYAPKIFLNCEGIDFDYVRSNINFVTYVRERQLADIFVFGTLRKTAGSGREYTLTFTGLNYFAGADDTLKFYSTSNETQEIIRRKFLRILKLGLMQYVLETPIANNLSFKLEESEISNEIENIKDKWDFWVFRTRINGELSGEQSHDNYEISGHLNADRITEDWKIRFDADVSYFEENFDVEDNVSWKSSSRWYKFDVDAVRSISSHFSLGGQLRFSSSTFRNINTSYQLSPAIEYSIFPYPESIYREIRLSYFVGVNIRNYIDETIYGKVKENLFRQGLQLNIEYKQPWGEIDIRGEYSHYLHDLSKGRLEFWGWFSINMFEGFSFDFGGGYSTIHDQLSLPKRDLDLEEILLNRAELATQYSYKLSFGVSYSFGSIFNNIVNSRFGD